MKVTYTNFTHLGVRLRLNLIKFGMILVYFCLTFLSIDCLDEFVDF